MRNSAKNIDVQEIYFAVFPLDQYMEIIEYNLLSNSKSQEGIENDVKNLQNLIKDAKYSSTKYNFKHFIAAEEEITDDGKLIKGTYNLITQDKNIIYMIL